MGLTVIDGFCNGSFDSRSRGASAMRTANMLVEKNGPAGRGAFTLVPRAGKVQFTDIAGGYTGWVGAWANRTRVFGVAEGTSVEFGTKRYLIEILQDGSFTAAGSSNPMDTDGNPAVIRSNGNQLMIASGGKAYVAVGTDLIQPVISYARGYGTVSVVLGVNTLTWTSGDKFDDFTAGDTISFDDGTTVVTASVLGVTDNEHVSIDVSVPAGDYFYQAGSEVLTASSIEYIDGYFIVSVPDSRQFRISNLNNGKIWDTLDVGEKLGTVDYIACVRELGGQLALIGNNNSTEIWADSGDADFPFVRISGRSLNSGTDAAYSVAKMPDGSLIWLYCAEMGREMLVQTTGGEPVRISNHAFENAIRKYSRIDDAIGSTFIENGHPIYRIDFPTADRTWFWDGSTGVMSEIGPRSGSSLPEVYTSDPAYFNVQVLWPNGTRMRLGFDHSSGKVWKISPDYLDDDGTDFEVLRIAPHIAAHYDRVSCAAFALDCELGTIGDGSTPKVYGSYSDDGAQTWSTEEPASLGRTGEFQGMELTDVEAQTNDTETLPIWRAWGSFFIAKTFKIRSTGKELRAVYDGLVDLSK